MNPSVSTAATEELLRIGASALAPFRRQIPRAVLDELCQEAAARTLRAATVQHLGPFVYTVARRLALDWLRRRREVVGEERFEEYGDTSWQRSVERRLDLRRVAAALDEAPGPYRELIEALYVREVDLDDVIADELASRGEGADGYARVRDVIYKRRTRALAWLRRRLAEDT